MRVLGIVLLALLHGSPVRAQAPADRIYRNARIWTGDPARPYAEAMAVAGDRIVALGAPAEMAQLRGPRTTDIDLGGRPVLPGFIDSHWHFSATERADLAGAGSVPAILERLRQRAGEQPSGWLLGHGWSYTDFPDRIPDRRHLDQAFPSRPVVIYERDGHMLLANSAALAAAGIDDATRDPPNGRLERDPDGRLTGELKESAMGLVTRHLPAPTADAIYAALQHVMRRAASYGLTSIHYVTGGLDRDELAVFERALQQDELPVRFYITVPFREDVTDSQLADFVALRDRHRGPRLKLGAAKGVLDGTVDAKTAAMLAPYAGAGTEAGIPMWTQDALNRTVARYDSAGFQILLHAIGDRAIRMALDAFEEAGRRNGSSGRRHRVEHVEVPDPADLPRFKALGVIASTQAMFAYPDATTLGNYAVLLGPERAARANAFNRFDEAGAVQAFGSDHPVFTMEVLRGINTAVNRTTAEGTPAGGWFPANRISVEAALRHFTRDGAWASFDEADKGTLAPGKLADFVVLSRDILAGPPDRLSSTRVLLTVMGGRETYRAAEPAWSAP